MNALEVAAGVTLTGKVEEGSTLFVTTAEHAQAGHRRRGRQLDRGLRSGRPCGRRIPARIRMEATDIAGNTRTRTTSSRSDTSPPKCPSRPRSTSAGRIAPVLRDLRGRRESRVTRIDADGSRTKPRSTPKRIPATMRSTLLRHPGLRRQPARISSTDLAGNQNATLFVPATGAPSGRREQSGLRRLRHRRDRPQVRRLERTDPDRRRPRVPVRATTTRSPSMAARTTPSPSWAARSLIGSDDGYSIYTLAPRAVGSSSKRTSTSSPDLDDALGAGRSRACAQSPQENHKAGRNVTSANRTAGLAAVVAALALSGCMSPGPRQADGTAGVVAARGRPSASGPGDTALDPDAACSIRTDRRQPVRDYRGASRAPVRDGCGAAARGPDAVLAANARTAEATCAPPPRVRGRRANWSPGSARWSA